MREASISVSSADIFNYIIGTKSSFHYLLYGVLEMNGRIDAELLQQAVIKLHETEPILQCRLILDETVPVWRAGISYPVEEYFSIVETKDREKDIENFMSVTIDPCRQPLAQTRLVRDGVKDVLCVKLSHACADAVACKEYIGLLAEIYQALAAGQEYQRRKFPVSRNLKLILESLGIKDNNDLPKLESELPNPTLGFPYASHEFSLPRWSKRFLEKECFLAIKQFAAVHKVTLNDVFLTAFARALPVATKQAVGSDFSIIVTVDLRRYTKAMSPICNFSGGSLINASNLPRESFVKALSRIAGAMRKVKDNLPGVAKTLEMEEYLQISFDECLQKFAAEKPKTSRNDIRPPLFSNTGILSTDVLRFGQIQAEKAYILTPPFYPPGLLFGISTYQDCVTLCTPYYQPAVEQGVVERFMDAMLEELLQLGSTGVERKD